MGRNFGKCALCGKECELTFEHIPPRAAFNSERARPVAGKVLMSKEVIEDPNRMPWDTSGLQYQNMQKGMGAFSLCPECNNNTGSWYGDAYVEFAKIAHIALHNLSVEENKHIVFKQLYPARIFKQVLSMFCSINGSDAKALEPVRKFVLDRDAVGLDKTKFKLCMYFTKSDFMKYASFTVLFKGLFENPKSIIVSEITAYPFGFLLYLDPTDDWEYQGTDITACADLRYDDVRDMVIPWRIEEMNDLFPEFLRSKEEIRHCIEENRKWAEEHELQTQTME